MLLTLGPSDPSTTNGDPESLESDPGDRPAGQSQTADGGGAPILVIDDNEVVRSGLARVLEQAGYRVQTAPHGLAALLSVGRRPYRVIVCDIMMPVMDGVDFFHEIAKLHPEAAQRVLFVTAWGDEPTVRPLLAATGRPVLQKPFEIDEFLRAVRDVADTAA